MFKSIILAQIKFLNHINGKVKIGEIGVVAMLKITYSILTKLNYFYACQVGNIDLLDACAPDIQVNQRWR